MRRIRLHDTRSGELLPLRPDPEQRSVGVYACGPTVYSRIHIGNARPFVIFSLLKRFLEHEGLNVTLVINITDVNDKIYDAARAQGRPSAELAAEMAERYRADTDALGLGRPDDEPLASETIGPIIGYIEDLVASGHAYRGGRRRVLSRALGPRLRNPLPPASRGHGAGRRGRGLRAQGGPAGLRAVEGAQAGRGHGLGVAVGGGAARLAHRVLGDGRGVCSASASTSMAAALTCCSPTMRTRQPRPARRAGASSPGCGCTTG